MTRGKSRGDVITHQRPPWVHCRCVLNCWKSVATQLFVPTSLIIENPEYTNDLESRRVLSRFSRY